MVTTFLKVKNRAESSLASGMDDVQTTAPLVSGGAAKYPSTFPFHVSIEDEIIRVNGTSGDTLDPVVRGQEGTTPATHAGGTTVELLITAQQISDIHDAVNALEDARPIVTYISLGSEPIYGQTYSP